jgi:hypothetical protein
MTAIVVQQRGSRPFIDFQASIDGGDVVVTPLVQSPLAVVTDASSLRGVKALVVHCPTGLAYPSTTQPLHQIGPRDNDAYYPIEPFLMSGKFSRQRVCLGNRTRKPIEEKPFCTIESP